MAERKNTAGLIDPADILKMVSGEAGTEPTGKVQKEFEEINESESDVEAEIDEEDLEEESENSYEDGIDAALESIDLANYKEDAILSKREDTRSRLAIIYTLLTFLVFMTSIFVAVLDGLNRNVSIIENLKEIIPLISGVFFGTLGFVLGYYFRKEEADNSSS